MSTLTGTDRGIGGAARTSAFAAWLADVVGGDGEAAVVANTSPPPARRMVSARNTPPAAAS
ncbi:hypothetical protein [Streptomyces sp. RPT161]|uniref:hypothetical protein n=1 Tax=Streptomyces sp. RPT161 TaxID=3015993 RepID=UPI0022B8D219|nr:hypothetical protein [Streptomyces sp. RPT161]